MARPSMWMAVIMGATAGFMLAYQNSCGRLMGLKVRCAVLCCVCCHRTWCGAGGAFPWGCHITLATACGRLMGAGPVGLAARCFSVRPAQQALYTSACQSSCG